MNNRYSPSRLNTFDACKLQYKYKYIDNLKSDLTTIENFLGSRIHETLENFYKRIKNNRIESLDWVLKEYENLWKKNFDDSIKVVRKDFTAEDYFKKGKQCLVDYYNYYKPFNQAKIVATEYHADFKIEDSGS